MAEFYSAAEGLFHPLPWSNFAPPLSEELEISIETVRRYIRSGRRAGDPRATRMRPAKRIMAAEARRRNIIELKSRGFDVKEIAKALSIHPRLVQMRLKEATAYAT